MKVTITNDKIEVDGGLGESWQSQLADHQHDGIAHCVRLASLEECAWAVKRLGEEMEKSIAYYRTGNPADNIIVK